MKNVKTNQNGYALILVLLTIALIGIFIPLIIANIFNNTLQYQKIEESNQLFKLEEMAYLYIEKALERSSYHAKEELTLETSSATPLQISEQYKLHFEVKLASFEFPRNSEEPFQFEISILDIEDEIHEENKTIIISIDFEISTTTDNWENINATQTMRTITLHIEE